VFGYISGTISPPPASDASRHFAMNAFWASSTTAPVPVGQRFRALNGMFLYLLRAPTAAGQTVMEQIDGLELYIRTAGANRLSLAGAPDLTTEQFDGCCLCGGAEAMVGGVPVGRAPIPRGFRGLSSQVGTAVAARQPHFGSSMSSAVSAAAGAFRARFRRRNRPRPDFPEAVEEGLRRWWGGGGGGAGSPPSGRLDRRGIAISLNTSVLALPR
jgi:hypothetical protein